MTAHLDLKPYEILGVGAEASIAEIKAAFRRKAKRLHPDNGGDPVAFHQLKQAYDLLTEGGQHHPDGESQAEEPAAAAEAAEEEAAALIDLFADEALETLAGELLVVCVNQAGTPEFDDLVSRMRRTASQNVEVADMQIGTLQALIHKVSAMADRVECKSGHNDLQELAARRRRLLEERVAEIRRHRELNERLVAVLKNYRYRRAALVDDII